MVQAGGASRSSVPGGRLARGDGRPKSSAVAAGPGSDVDASKVARARRTPHVILFDVMDTIVVDPYPNATAAFFGCTAEELTGRQHPDTWVRFERGEISERELGLRFWRDEEPRGGASEVDGAKQEGGGGGLPSGGSAEVPPPEGEETSGSEGGPPRLGERVPVTALAKHVEANYRFVPGMEELLEKLATAAALGQEESTSATGASVPLPPEPSDSAPRKPSASSRTDDLTVEKHLTLRAFSNYPVWWRRVERRLRLSRFLSWSFVSCEATLRGARKPQPEAFEAALRGVLEADGVPPSSVIFVDDSPTNVQAALEAGIGLALVFRGARELEAQLRQAGLEF